MMFDASVCVCLSIRFARRHSSKYTWQVKKKAEEKRKQNNYEVEEDIFLAVISCFIPTKVAALILVMPSAHWPHSYTRTHIAYRYIYQIRWMYLFWPRRCCRLSYQTIFYYAFYADIVCMQCATYAVLMRLSINMRGMEVVFRPCGYIAVRTVYIRSQCHCCIFAIALAHHTKLYIIHENVSE